MSTDLDAIEAKLAEACTSRNGWYIEYVKARDALRAIYAKVDPEKDHGADEWMTVSLRDEISALVIGALGKNNNAERPKLNEHQDRRQSSVH